MRGNKKKVVIIVMSMLIIGAVFYNNNSKEKISQSIFARKLVMLPYQPTNLDATARGKNNG